MASWIKTLKEEDPLGFAAYREKQRRIGKASQKEHAEAVKAFYDKKPWEELGKDAKRRRVIDEQQHCCNLCGLAEWRGQKIPLELDHKDGVHMNDDRDNLEALCPNCHSLTDTWRGKNKTLRGRISDQALAAALLQSASIRQALLAVGLSPRGANYVRAKRLLATVGVGEELSSEPTYRDPVPPKFCPCGKGPISPRAKLCATCGHKPRIDWPPIEELKMRVDASNLSAVGRELGVSANAVMKHLKRYS